MSFGLESNTIGKIKSVFTKYPEIEKVIIYGSRAKGNYSNGSDIDITLTGNGLTIPLINKIENDLDDLYLPYTFDISILSHIKNKKLIDHIKRVGIEFYVKK